MPASAPGVGGPRPADERRHEPDGDPTFTECWTFAAGPGVATPALEVVVGLRPGLGDGWFEARLTGPGEDLVLVADRSLETPRGPGLEIRAPGLWADHVVEEPLRRWTLGLEAFGVALPLAEVGGADLLDPDLRGERVPVGWDLEWESDEPSRWAPRPNGGPRYVATCRVTGEVLIGAERHELDVAGHRAHEWGAASPSLPNVR